MNRRKFLAAIGGLFLIPSTGAARPPQVLRAADGGMLIDLGAGEIKIFSDLPAGSVRADQIAVGSITASRIGSDTVHRGQIHASAISARTLIISKEN